MQPDTEPGNAPVTAQKLFLKKLKDPAARLTQGVLWLQNHTLPCDFSSQGKVVTIKQVNRETKQQVNKPTFSLRNKNSLAP
jgi:hypothetical protein